MSSLDAPGSVPPKIHIHASSRLPWIKPGDGLPECPEEKDDSDSDPRL